MNTLYFYQPVSMWHEVDTEIFIEQAKAELMQGIVSAYLDSLKEQLYKNITYNEEDRRVETHMSLE